MAKKITLNEIAAMLTKQSSEFKDLTQSVGFVIEHMATKDDLASMATKDDLADLRSELKDDIADIRAAMVTKVDYHDLRQELHNLHADLKELRANVENMSGFRKEIDHALERIAAIERHLGLNKKIAA